MLDPFTSPKCGHLGMRGCLGSFLHLKMALLGQFLCGSAEWGRLEGGEIWEPLCLGCPLT